jgi:YVTN family beta-propeller protein
MQLCSLLRLLAMQTSLYNPAGIAISPDGSRAYVASLNDPGTLLTIDIQKQQVIQTLPVTKYPQSVFLSPDGSLLWITFALDNQIVVVDTLTNTIVKTFTAFIPGAVAFNSTGTLAFVTLNAFNQVEVINTTTYAVVQNIPVGAGPLEIGIAPDDTFAVVTNFSGQSLTMINLTGYATSTIPLPGPPLGLSLRY